MKILVTQLIVSLRIWLLLVVATITANLVTAQEVASTRNGEVAIEKLTIDNGATPWRLVLSTESESGGLGFQNKPSGDWQSRMSISADGSIMINEIPVIGSYGEWTSENVDWPGPPGDMGDKGDLGTTVGTVAACGPDPAGCFQICRGSGTNMVGVIAPCIVTSDSGGCNVGGPTLDDTQSSEQRGLYCCVCKPGVAYTTVAACGKDPLGCSQICEDSVVIEQQASPCAVSSYTGGCGANTPGFFCCVCGQPEENHG